MVGTNLVRLSQLETVTMEMYRKVGASNLCCSHTQTTTVFLTAMSPLAGDNSFRKTFRGIHRHRPGGMGVQRLQDFWDKAGKNSSAVGKNSGYYIALVCSVLKTWRVYE